MDPGIALIEQPHTSRGSLMVGREKQCISCVYSPRLIDTSADDSPVITRAAVAGPPNGTARTGFPSGQCRSRE